MRHKDIQRLGALAAAVFEAELARMRGNRAAVAEVMSEVVEVRQSRRDRADTMRSLDAPDPAQLASADLHWDRWTDEKLRRLQAERARLEAEAAAMRAGAKRAFGRREALAGIGERVRAESLRKNAKRT